MLEGGSRAGTGYAIAGTTAEPTSTTGAAPTARSVTASGGVAGGGCVGCWAAAGLLKADAGPRLMYTESYDCASLS